MGLATFKLLCPLAAFFRTSFPPKEILDQPVHPHWEQISLRLGKRGLSGFCYHPGRGQSPGNPRGRPPGKIGQESATGWHRKGSKTCCIDSPGLLPPIHSCNLTSRPQEQGLSRKPPLTGVSLHMWLVYWDAKIRTSLDRPRRPQ